MDTFKHIVQCTLMSNNELVHNPHFLHTILLYVQKLLTFSVSLIMNTTTTIAADDLNAKLLRNVTYITVYLNVYIHNEHFE